MQDELYIMVCGRLMRFFVQNLIAISFRFTAPSIIPIKTEGDQLWTFSPSSKEGEVAALFYPNQYRKERLQ